MDRLISIYTPGHLLLHLVLVLVLVLVAFLVRCRLQIILQVVQVVLHVGNVGRGQVLPQCTASLQPCAPDNQFIH